MSNRLTSAIFVSALIRRVSGEGGFAAVLRHGSDDAGAIFIVVPGGFSEGASLYAQVPQSMMADLETPPSGGRLFEKLGSDMSPDEMDEKFRREARLDPDFWVVELELFGRKPSDYFDIA